jgi:hypothetical protein
MLVANGRVVHTVGDVSRPESLFSCSKLVTFMLAAKAVQDGSIADLDQAVPNDPAGAWGSYPGDATLRQFLTMTADYGLPNARPGSRYAYNNNAVDFLGERLGQRIFGQTLPDQMPAVVRSELFAVLGQQDGDGFVGQWGGWFGGLQLSTRDLGRLGYLLLRGGVWNGQRLLPAEFVDGLFQSQIPAGLPAYQSSNPTENSQWNQQAVTDTLGGSWSFGMWRVEPARSDGSWLAAAAEGYRGKRLILMPRGTLPDPQLEVMLVCLPRLSDEGPSSAQYRQIVVNALLGHPVHPDHDPRSIAATFDDGSLYPLEPRLGAPFVRHGGLALEGEQRLVHRAATLVDGQALWRLPDGIPAGAWSGIVVRAASPADDFDRAGGPQALIRLVHEAGLGLRAEVLAPSLPGPLRSVAMTGIPTNAPIQVYVRFVGDRVDLRVNGFPAFGLPGRQGLPGAGTAGHLSLRHGGAWTGLERVDYLLLRAEDGPVGLISNDTAGEHSVSLLEPDVFGALQPQTWFHELTMPGQGPIALPIDLFPPLVTAFWPGLIGFDGQHISLSSRGAPARLPAGTGLVFDYKGRREGAFLR